MFFLLRSILFVSESVSRLRCAATKIMVSGKTITRNWRKFLIFYLVDEWSTACGYWFHSKKIVVKAVTSKGLWLYPGVKRWLPLKLEDKEKHTSWDFFGDIKISFGSFEALLLFTDRIISQVRLIANQHMFVLLSLKVRKFDSVIVKVRKVDWIRWQWSKHCQQIGHAYR